MKHIVTHNGSAHRDDLFAVSFLIYKEFLLTGNCLAVHRKQTPTFEDLEDPDVYVVDFGRRFEPEFSNFDHHQMKGGEVCAFTQVLEHFNMRDYDALPWIQGVEIWDHCGPADYFQWLSGDPCAANKDMVFCPALESILEVFSEYEVINLEDAHMYDTLFKIGERVHGEYTSYHTHLEDLKINSKCKQYGDFYILDLRGLDKPDNTNFSALRNHIKSLGGVDFILNVNTRGEGGLRLIRRAHKWDLNDAANEMTFVHQNGFLACFDDEGDEDGKINRILTKLNDEP